MDLQVACFFCLALILTAGKVAGQSCPDGWTSHDESCYHFMSETYNWFDAKVICGELGGILVEVASQEEQEYIQGVLQQNSANEAWIGLQDFAEEGIWVWTSSKQLADSQFWLPGEPEDRQHEEDCVITSPTGWFDVNCEDRRASFICEKEMDVGSVVG